ncbi:hypothetical protein K402DRAFT_390305 [Aulographum hederae CBS 113979]|uniref:Uncharacterized protein n=1 Tax=Aulographum hederae CBS 113979 TaxID=1176131 RepID=A0A6G1HA92_9PEZI|nr:hypothetical protein K402DRAFT_390305 [Aulographum hederae CBS 113979]
MKQTLILATFLGLAFAAPMPQGAATNADPATTQSNPAAGIDLTKAAEQGASEEQLAQAFQNIGKASGAVSQSAPEAAAEAPAVEKRHGGEDDEAEEPTTGEEMPGMDHGDMDMGGMKNKRHGGDDDEAEEPTTGEEMPGMDHGDMDMGGM